MYHLRLKGEHYDMGVRRGTIFNRCGVKFPLQLDSFQLNHGIQSEKILRQFFPEVCLETEGFSRTLQIDYKTFMSWLLCMGCCMYNLERNVPVEVRGCTAFAFSQNGNVIYARNNDLPPYLEKLSNSELYSPDGGHRFNITTSSFINGEEGLGDCGLAVAMTFVATNLNDIRPGFNSPFIVRYLLEKAHCVENALELLHELPVSSNCNILLADRTGEMAVVECTPHIKRIRRPVESSGVKIVCTVNNFTSDEMRSYDFSDGDVYNSRERYNVVMRTVPTFSGENVIEDVQKLLSGDYGFMCQYNDPHFKTVWSSIFNLKNLAISRAEGDPRRVKFKDDLRLRK